MIASIYGQDLLGGPKIGYNQIFDWTELRNDKGGGLHIGVEVFDSANTSFVVTIPCLDVQAGLAVMVSDDIYIVTIIILLYATSLTPRKIMNVLESVEINRDKSVISDSMMFQIKRSSAPDQDTPTILYQSIATPNRHFCQFVIDYLSMVLYFDCWYPFLSNSTPAPYRKVSNLVSNYSNIIFMCLILFFFILMFLVPECS